jgi:GNAT superfamily N-acetyltransferase
MAEEFATRGRVAGPDDVDAVAACLASAFYADPVWGLWAFPDERDRERRLFELMRAFVAAGVRHPWVRMTSRCEAAIVWVPPGESEMTAEEELVFDDGLDALAEARAPEFRRLFELFEECHPQDEPHYYLSLWGAQRDHARRGFGGALMRESLALIDGERMSAYLESTNPANIPRYESLGFQARDSFGPEGGPTITTMWRAGR